MALGRGELAVWAPGARAVDAVVRGSSTSMRPAAGGWWVADGVLLRHGEDYGFRLDGAGETLPDPRSRWQPDGVHGLSRMFDPAEHEWHDDRWTGRQLAGSVVYELHVGTFTPAGTLDGAIDRLDHLVDLGVDVVELLPVNAFDGTHGWGYDGVLWFAVHDAYGGPAAYQRFVDACHRRGLAVVQDVVYNHLGPSGNYLPRFAPYLHPGASNTWGASVNFDEIEVRRYVLDNAVMWCRDFHVDGLRLDAVHALHDTSPRHILQELAGEIDAWSAFLGRPLTVIAESDRNDPTTVTPREAGGLGVHAQWSDDFHHALHVALTGETSGYYADFEHLDALAKVCTDGFFHDGTYSSFRGRFHGAPIDVATFAAWRLVVCNQNHDQIGNRAAGDRLSASLDPGQLAIAAVLTMTAPFTPMLFMGEEWGASTPWQFFTSHPDPELGRATADGRMAEFARMGWDPAAVPDPQDPATFERSKLDWSERDAGPHRRLLDLYRSLLELRRAVPELTDPRLWRTRVELDTAARWFVVHRGEVAVCANFADVANSVDVRGEVLLSTIEDVACDASGLLLPPHSAAIVDGRRNHPSG